MARGIVLLLILFLPSAAYAMPPVAVAVASAAFAGFSGVIAGTAVAFSWASFGLSLAISALSMAFTPKPKKPTGSYTDIKGQGSTQQFRQAVTEREMVYGEVRKSGPMVFAGTTDSNRYLHLIIVLASHECKEIGECIVDDYSITDDMMDAGGNVNTGRYSGYIRIKKHLGESGQAADNDAVSEIPEWTTSHKLSGCAYVYVRLKWSQDKFPSGIPNFSFWVKGKKIYDPRDTSTVWQPSIPLFVRDYLSDTTIGLGVNSAYIDDDTIETAANESDEYVTTSNLDKGITAVDTSTDILTLAGTVLEFTWGDKVRLTAGTIGGLSSGTDYYVAPYQRQTTPRTKLASSYANLVAGTYINLTSGTSGTLTKIAEPRYHGGGIVKSGNEPSQDISEIIPSMAGTVTYSGGKWRVYAGTYRVPTVYFDEDDLAGPIQVVTKVSKQDRFNRISGIYSSFLNNGNPSNYPLVKNDYYAEQDGEIIQKTRDFAFTQRPHTAMRLAKAELERSRQEISFSAPFKLTAFKALIADNVYFSFDRYGWENKIFEVTNWQLTSDGTRPVINMTLREMASTVYDWVNGEETSVDPAPNTTLPSVFDVSAPTSLAVYPVEVDTAGADTTYKFNFVWTAPDDGYVVQGGKFEIQFRESSETSYRPSYFVDGEQTFTDIYQVKPATSYDARVRAINVYGVRSQWAALEGFTVAAPEGTTDRADYGLFSETVTDNLDYGLFSDSVGASEDYGSFV